MDEKSIWKKEISFRRKSKADTVPAAPGEEPKSVWKREISFRRKSKPAATKTVASAPKAAAAAPKQSFLRKEITLGRRPKPEPAEVSVEEPVREVQAEVVAPAPEWPVRDSGPGEGVREDREVSPTTAPVPKQAESWESKPEAPPAPEVPPSPEVPSEPELPPAAEAPTVEVAPPVEPAVPAPAPVPAPAAEVHPPVSAAELPPLPEERKEKPTPFWRRELVLGRRAPTAPKVEAPA